FKAGHTVYIIVTESDAAEEELLLRIYKF
ncbi:hypothetical protein, partial [Staphylococcus aureus]